MRAILSSLLATSLLVHAAIGCCWHHGTEGARCNESTLALATDVECDHDHFDGISGHQSHTPCKGNSHCHGTCSYLPAKNTQKGKSVLSHSFDIAGNAQSSGQTYAAAVSIAKWNGEVAVHPPLRLHLLHQILLI